MTSKQDINTAPGIMEIFARDTGLSDRTVPPRRYLWTDAFAVCNFLALYNRYGEEKYLTLAGQLVDQVHRVLGRHRDDDPRTGWISGLSDAEGERHPTLGGLRIGKKLPERKPRDVFDDRSEWDRDGQYFHYLTRWMHALDQFSRVTGEPAANQWAREMARAVHDRFTYAPTAGGPKRMYWKMSIDLSWPLVPSMGHHDPLDGLITYLQIRATFSENDTDPDLDTQITDMAEICRGRDWTTDDPLGLGGLMTDAFRLAQLIVAGCGSETALLADLLDASAQGLNSLTSRDGFNLPASYRLAFRELGLAIGLRAAQKLKNLVQRRQESFSPTHRILSVTEELLKHSALVEEIENFWLTPDHRRVDSWTGHQDINSVMLATSLEPDGYLELR